MKASITHQQACQWLRSGSPLAVESGRLLDAHLETCANCREYARLISSLEKQLPEAVPYFELNDRELARRQGLVLEKTGHRFRRQRLLTGARDLSWVVPGAVLVILLSFVLRTLIPRQEPVVGTERTQTPVATATPPGMLGASSSPAEIRQRILNSFWSTLVVSGLTEETLQDGSKTNRFVQAWLDRSGGGRVLISDSMPDGVEFSPETPVSQAWATDGQQVLNYDFASGATSPLERTATMHPLESTDPLIASLLPAMFVDVFDDPVLVEVSTLDTRPIIVVDWVGNRLTVDAFSGVILRRQFSGENGAAIDVRLVDVVYDEPLPGWAYQLSGLETSRFIPVELSNISQPPQDIEIPSPEPVDATASPVEPVGDVILLDVFEPPAEAPPTEQELNTPELYFVTRSLGAPVSRFIMRAGVDCLLTSGRCPTTILPESPNPGDAPLSWSPDGRFALLFDTAGRKLYIYERQNASWGVLLDNALIGQVIVSWSPDGSQFVISLQDGSTDNFLATLVSVDSASVTALAPDLGGVQVPIGWLDAQNFLVMVDRPIPKGQSGDPVTPTLYRISVQDGAWNELPIQGSASWLTSYPALSPDGTRIALTMPGVSSNELTVVTVDGSQTQALGVEAVNPVWSPDGTWIVFSAWDGGGTRIFVVHPDGSEMREVFSWGAYSWASWFPDSLHILVQTLPPPLSDPEEDHASMYLVSLVEGWSRRLALSERDGENELVFPSVRTP